MTTKLKFTTFVAAGAIALGAMASSVSAESLTVVSWGGAYTKSQVEAYHKPFTKETGISILSENYSGGLAEVKAQVEAGSVKWDLIDLEMSDAVRGCDEGLFEQIDPAILPKGDDGTPAEKDFIDGSVTDCAVGTIVWSTIYAYDKGKFPGGGPKTMADFFDTKAFPGKRGMRKTPKANLEMALIADGVSNDKVYAMLETPAGVDRAFAKLDSIKDSVVWWEAGAQPPQLLADGEVAMTTAYNGRIFNAIAVESKAFEIVWDGQVYDLDLWAVPKGAPNKDTAMKFIAFSTDTKRLAAQAAWISYGPVRNSSIPLIGKHAEAGIEMGPHMPTAAANFKTAIQNDFEFWADRQDELNNRFNAWLSK